MFNALTLDKDRTYFVTSKTEQSSVSINIYVYGVIMDITDGRGVQTFDEICKVGANAKFIDICSGIGGFVLVLEKHGDDMAFAKIDKFAKQKL